MSMNDPVSDMLTRIRNGQSARLARVLCPASKLLANLLNVLKDEGYIRDYSQSAVEGGKSDLIIDLKYHDGEPVIKEIKRISKPGCRTYANVNTMPTVHNGLGISIISTSHGVMSDYKARQANIGGEVLCTVF